MKRKNQNPVGKCITFLSLERNSLHKIALLHSTSLTTHTVNAVPADHRGSDCQRGSEHVPFVCTAKREDEVLKLLAEWERCI